MSKINSLPSGLVLLNKQAGCTSFDSLRCVKRAFGTGKAGHTGTLDKFAEGLLLVLMGRALKLSRWFTHCDKQYEGVISFGVETSTLDPEGDSVEVAPPPSLADVENVLPRFRGDILQAPPAFSAIHIDGERASVLARRGEIPKMEQRPVRIYRLEILDWTPPFARIFVHCSGGTYIRSLARDIAIAAGSRAHLCSLKRTRVAGFRLEDAVSPDDFEQGRIPRPLSPDKQMFSSLSLPRFEVTADDAEQIRWGRPLSPILSRSVFVQPDDLAPDWGIAQNTQSGERCQSPISPPFFSDFSKITAEAAAVFCGETFVAMVTRCQSLWAYGCVYADN